MRIWAALAAMTVTAGAGTAHAAIVQGNFTATVTSGTVFGAYGYVAETDLTGQAISGTFRYDTDALGGNCPSGRSFFGCFLSTSGVRMTHRINGVTVAFGDTSTPGNPQAQANISQAGLLLNDLGTDTLNLQNVSESGNPASFYRETHTGLGVELAPGSILDATNPVLVYTGAVGQGTIYNLRGHYFANQSGFYDITAGFRTRSATYAFDVDSFSAALAVPEPASWALMVGGFALVGAALRRRRCMAA